MIKITGGNFSYPGQADKALKDINLAIKEGSFCALLGPNGSGKSTLIHLLNGLNYPQTGDITVDGLSVKDENVWQVRKKLAMTFQNPDNQIVGTTVERDMAFGPENLGLDKKIILKRIDDVLKSLALEEQRHAEPHSLSQGQKQKLAIAGALVMDSKYLVLDEPASMLDFHSQEEITEILERLNKEGKTILFSTHDLDMALRAKEIILLIKGRLTARFAKSELPSYLGKLVESEISLPFWAKVAHRLDQQQITIGAYTDSKEFEEQFCSLLRT